MKNRNARSAEFKAMVTLEALRGEVTIAALAVRYSVHPTQINNWKAEAIRGFSRIFGGDSRVKHSDQEVALLERKIGQLTMENEFLKKTWEGYRRRKDAA